MASGWWHMKIILNTYYFKEWLCCPPLIRAKRLTNKYEGKYEEVYFFCPFLTYQVTDATTQVLSPADAGCGSKKN